MKALSRGAGAAAWALLALVLAGPTAAAQSVGGTWNVRWAQAIRIERDGTVVVRRWGDGTLTLAVRGGSVSGEWTTETAREPVTWTVSGSTTGGSLRLTATENDSNDPEIALIERVDFEATVGAEALEGHIRMTIRGQDREPVSRPFSASRGGS